MGCVASAICLVAWLGQSQAWSGSVFEKDTGLKVDFDATSRSKHSMVRFYAPSVLQLQLIVQRLNRAERQDYEIRFAPRPELDVFTKKNDLPFESLLRQFCSQTETTYGVYAGIYHLIWRQEPEKPIEWPLTADGAGVWMNAVGASGADCLMKLMFAIKTPYRLKARDLNRVTLKMESVRWQDAVHYVVTAAGVSVRQEGQRYLFERP